MTRINTNVSSLIAQKSLARSNATLQEALTRLSTGLRINVGKDDPAGLIASEMLRSDIISGQRAITNSERANQMIATADSSLAQVSALLNDIRGLITEAANTGALSAEQIAANQAQVDSSLEALNRIAQTTTFQGRRLLDGSLNFISTAQAVATIEDIEIDQANLGATGQIGVNVEIAAAATRATIESASGDANAVTQLKFSPRVRLQFNAAAAEIDLVALTVGPQYEGVTVNFIDNGGAAGSGSATYDQDSKIVTVNYALGVDLTADIMTYLGTLTDFEAVIETDGAAAVLTLDPATYTAASPTLNFTAATAGMAFNDVSVEVDSADLGGAGTAYQVTYNTVSKRLAVTLDLNAVDGNRDLALVAGDLDAALTGIFNVTATGGTTDLRAQAALSIPETEAVGNSEISGYLRSGFSAGTRATATLSFAAGATAALVTTDVGDAISNVDIKSTSLTAGDAVDISFLDDALVAAGAEYAVYDSGAGTLVVHYDGGNSTVTQVVAAISALDDWTAVDVDSEGASFVTAAAQPTPTTDTDTLEIAALNPGADYNQLEILLETVDTLGAPIASYNATTGQLTIQIDATGSETLASLKTAVDALAEFSAATHQRGVTAGRIYGDQVDATATANTSSTGGNTLLDDLVIEIGGTDGSEAFNFQTGASVNSVMAAINLVADASGVAATQGAGLLTLTSVRYGSNGLVYTDVISEGTVGTFEDSASARRTNGTDIDATVNGIAADGDGNEMSINTATLDLALTVTAGSSTDFEFAITGGGAMFQLGPDVVSNQQARLGIQSVNAARLRGVSGRLYQIGSGQSAALATDPTTGAAIVDEVITKVTELRGRLGAFQKTTVESNIRALEGTLENLTAAESAIRDADFAVETAALTRAQILVQAGMSVLSIANSNPQNVLALLR